MTFENFVQNVVDRIPEYLHQYDIETIRIEKVKKNNGVCCTSMVIILENENIAPNIYLEYFYTLYNNGKDIDDILILLAKEYVEAVGNLKEMEREDMISGMSPENVFLCLVNYDRNKEELSVCPHVIFQDLAVTFRCLLKTGKSGIASCLVHNEYMEIWGVDQEELYKKARKNTIKMFPPKLQKLEDMLIDLLTEKENVPKGDGLYVLTNEQGVNGATYMLYDDIIEEFAERADSNIYILPSSIHEVLLLPDNGSLKKEELQDMVREINKYVVNSVDFLSDNIYYYDIKKKIISY